MDLVPNLVNAALVVLVGIVLSYVIRDRFRQQDALMEARLDALRAQMDTRFESVDSRFESVDKQFASLRSDLTQIALAVGAQPRPQAG